MPVYEYRCGSCGEELEVKQRITDRALQECPGCGGSLQRLISNTSFILKGTGWYATDYARKGSSSSGETTSVAKTDSSSASSTSKSEKAD